MSPATRTLPAFSACGIELEYMIVDRDTLSVRPIADALLQAAAGEQVAEFGHGRFGWSNEFVLHLIEIKNLHPTDPLASLAAGFQAEIGSIDGMRLNPWETYSYHASKAAILYLTKRMAARLVTDHILVTAIAPGAFQSEMNKAARDHGDAVAKSIPVKRIGVPEDMAGAAIFLASKAGDYVVGDTITVDGGLVHGDLKTSIDA